MIIFYHQFATELGLEIAKCHMNAIDETYRDHSLRVEVTYPGPGQKWGEFRALSLMALHAMKHPTGNEDYLFLHAKGATDPPTNRSQMENYGVRTNEDITERVCSFIRSGRPEFKHFFYHIWNMFWISADLLREYAPHVFVANQGKVVPRDQKYYPMKDRHVFSLFPVKLYGIVKELKLETPIKDLINLNESTVNYTV